MIYLDYAATSYQKPECVYQSMEEAIRSYSVNAGRGGYERAGRAAKIWQQVKENLLELVHGIGRYEVALTPSATIALNEIIGGLKIEKDAEVYVSPYEHNAVIRPLYEMYPHIKQRELPLEEGSLKIDMETLSYQFAKHPPTHVFLTHVSNVTGYILPVEEILDLANSYGAVTVVDASQSLGLIPINFEKCSVDYLVFAGHKTLYGPFGIGGFFIRKGLTLHIYLAGGTGSDSLNPSMPKTGTLRYEPGSPNIPAAAGLLSSLMLLKETGKGDYTEGIRYYKEKEEFLMDKLVEGLKKISGIRLYLPQEDCHTSILSWNLFGYSAEDMGVILDSEYQIAVRTGYHCAPLLHSKLQEKGYGGTVRTSIGRFTTEQEITALTEAVEEIVLG